MAFDTLLTSAVISALVAGLVSLRASERSIQIDNITKERAKWRDKIKSDSLAVHQAVMAQNTTKISELIQTFSLNLNPFDSEDQSILATIFKLKSTNTIEDDLSEFNGRVAFLLKHDWERAKHEAKPWFFRLKAPKRRTYGPKQT